MHANNVIVDSNQFEVHLASMAQNDKIIEMKISSSITASIYEERDVRVLKGGLSQRATFAEDVKKLSTIEQVLFSTWYMWTVSTITVKFQSS